METTEAVDGHKRPIEENLLAGSGQEVGGKLAVEGFADGGFLVKADENVGGFAFFRGMDNSGHGIDRPAAVGLHAHIDGSGHFGGIVQLLLRFGAYVGIIVQDDRNCGELGSGGGGAEHQGQVDHRDERAWVVECYEEGVFGFARTFLLCLARKHDVVGRALSGHRGDEA